jgi:hypothetical protein
VIANRLLAALAIGPLLALVGPTATGAQQEGEFTISPSTGAPGTEVTARSVTPCPAVSAAGSQPRTYVAAVAFQSWAAIVPVPLEGGPWEVRTTVPDLPGEQLGVRAGCLVTKGNVVTQTLGYKAVPFDVTVPPPPPPSGKTFEIVIIDSAPASPTRGTPRFTG